MNKKIRILHLEDSLNDSDLIHSIIERGGISHEYFLADNEKDFINILETENVDIILSDYSLPDYSGNEAMKVARDKYSYMPFIFVSGAMGEDTAIEAMLNGVTDYVLKNKLERLVPAINRALHEYELEIKRKQAEAALYESERKYKELINEVNDGYFVTNIEGIITFANSSLAKILGFTTAEEIIGYLFIEFSKTKGNASSFKNIIENKKKIDGLEMEVVRLDGNSIYVEINAVPVLEKGAVTGMQGVIHDITERKQAELKLIEKNEQIEAQNELYIQINKELAFQNEEREKRASELIIANIQKATEEKYKLLIEEKNRDITNSLNYAKLIQQAKLPKKEEIYDSFPDSFVLYKPKAIVSGDFYFFHRNNQSVFLVAADCTGHGVPGALLSMIGSEKLSDAVSQTTDTSEILKLLNNGIKNSLHRSNSKELVIDGMDIAICSINTKNGILKYAGAKIPLWLIRSGKTEVEEIKGNLETIGGFTDDNQKFASHELKLKKGDTFYISTDGYADQFSGQDGRKLMKRKFKEILIEIQDRSMQEQEKYLDNFVENWKAGKEQIDDILVIGVRM